MLPAWQTDPDYRYKRATKDRDGTLHQKGEPNEKKLRDTLRRLDQLKAAACSFADYQQLLLERGRYDFSDMILWCIKAFEQSPDLLSRYQERYLYLLVDEFQDTSGSQYELLMQLADYWDAPNLFAVGDDDQSIYRFQGASIENIRRFQERYRRRSDGGDPDRQPSLIATDPGCRCRPDQPQQRALDR